MLTLNALKSRTTWTQSRWNDLRILQHLFRIIGNMTNYGLIAVQRFHYRTKLKCQCAWCKAGVSYMVAVLHEKLRVSSCTFYALYSQRFQRIQLGSMPAGQAYNNRDQTITIKWSRYMHLSVFRQRSLQPSYQTRPVQQQVGHIQPIIKRVLSDSSMQPIAVHAANALSDDENPWIVSVNLIKFSFLTKEHRKGLRQKSFTSFSWCNADFCVSASG